jgi:acetoacetyl-CoA synthetase
MNPTATSFGASEAISISPEPIWTPSRERIEQSNLARYMDWLNTTQGLRFADYESLWQWSATELEAFWVSIWNHCSMRSSQPYQTVLHPRTMPGARWFEGSMLNYADQMLWRARLPQWADQPAIIFQSECAGRREMSWSDLAAQAGALSASLSRLGVTPGDRVVAYMPNIPQTMAALLAVAGIGAIWSSCAPDMGSAGVLDRFIQRLLGTGERFLIGKILSCRGLHRFHVLSSGPYHKSSCGGSPIV